MINKVTVVVNPDPFRASTLLMGTRDEEGQLCPLAPEMVRHSHIYDEMRFEAVFIESARLYSV